MYDFLRFWKDRVRESFERARGKAELLLFVVFLLSRALASKYPQIPIDATTWWLGIGAFAAVLIFEVCFLSAYRHAKQQKEDLSAEIHRLTAERDSLSQQLDDKRPHLEGEIENIVTGPAVAQGIPVFVALCIRNAGNESIAEDFKLHIKTDDGEITLSPASIAPEIKMSINDQWLTIRRNDLIAQKAVSPIPRGGLVRGWVPFLIPKASGEVFKKGVTTRVSFRDVVKTRYSVSPAEYGAAGPALDYRPGLDLQWSREESATGPMP